MTGKNVGNMVLIIGSDDRTRYQEARKICRNSLKKKTRPNTKFLSCLEFTENMVNSIRYDRIKEFRRYFNSADALVIRDIETVGHKQRTQEELLEILRSFLHRRKRIIMTLYDNPNKIKGLSRPFRLFLKSGMLINLSKKKARAAKIEN